MTEEYELAAFDRHSLNYDNVALGRLPTSVTSDPSVRPLRELAYLPEGIMDPHDLPMNQNRAGKLPSQIIKELQAEKSREEDKNNSSDMVSNKLNSTN
jgi:NAD(P)H-quinone oxidoreductase subunit I